MSSLVTDLKKIVNSTVESRRRRRCVLGLTEWRFALNIAVTWTQWRQARSRVCHVSWSVRQLPAIERWFQCRCTATALGIRSAPCAMYSEFRSSSPAGSYASTTATVTCCHICWWNCGNWEPIWGTWVRYPERQRWRRCCGGWRPWTIHRSMCFCLGTPTAGWRTATPPPSTRGCRHAAVQPSTASATTPATPSSPSTADCGALDGTDCSTSSAASRWRRYWASTATSTSKTWGSWIITSGHRCQRDRSTRYTATTACRVADGPVLIHSPFLVAGLANTLVKCSMRGRAPDTATSTYFSLLPATTRASPKHNQITSLTRIIHLLKPLSQRR